MAVLSFIIDYLIQLLGTGTVHVQYCVCMNVLAVLINFYSKCTVSKPGLLMGYGSGRMAHDTVTLCMCLYPHSKETRAFK